MSLSRVSAGGWRWSFEVCRRNPRVTGPSPPLPAPLGESTQPGAAPGSWGALPRAKNTAGTPWHGQMPPPEPHSGGTTKVWGLSTGTELGWDPHGVARSHGHLAQGTPGRVQGKGLRVMMGGNEGGRGSC